MALSHTSTSMRETKIVNQWLNYQDKLIKMLLLFYTVGFGTYILLPIFKKNGLPFEWQLPKICYVNPWYKIIWEKFLMTHYNIIRSNKNETYITIFCDVKRFRYPTIYIIELIISIVRFIGVLSNDILCITFLCQLCSELELVKLLIIDLETGKVKNLIQTINRHAIALDYGGMVCKILSGTLLIQHMNCSILLCFGGLITLKVRTTKKDYE